MALNKLIICLILVLFTSPLWAKSSVWKVEKDGKHIFLGGTIHVLSPQDFPLACEFDAAFLQSDTIYLETDIYAMQSPAMMQTMLSQLQYTNGENLGEKLTASTFKRLDNYMNERRVPTRSVMSYKPGLLLSSLTIMELQRYGVNEMGVDQYYAIKASNEGRKTAFLEQPIEQIDFLAALGIGQEDDFVNYLLSDLETIESKIRLMTRHWRRGDMEQLAKDSELDRLRRLFPEVYQSLLAERNKKWMPQIEAMFNTSDVEFVLVGALHMPGWHGLLRLLEDKDYSITQLDGCL